MCAGDSELPVFPNVNPNKVSVQKLCAKPQYNGGEPGQHVGGYCILRPAMGGANSGEVGFDRMYISASRFPDQTVVLVLDMSREYCYTTCSLNICIRSFFRL